MNDIAATMFNKKFLLEIFLKNQPIQSRSMLRAMFDKLAHASVMRLNTSSMDKVGWTVGHLDSRSLLLVTSPVIQAVKKRICTSKSISTISTNMYKPFLWTRY